MKGTRRHLKGLLTVPLTNPAEMRQRLASKVTVTASGCHEWGGFIDPKGYGTLSYRNANVRAHRLAYAAHLGPVPDNMQVCHRCDNRRCINPDHLFLGTNRDNINDMVAKGRSRGRRGPRGSRSWAERTAEIIRRMAAGERQADIGQTFGLTQSGVSKALSKARSTQGVK